jgi:hypothetical protein
MNGRDTLRAEPTLSACRTLQFSVGDANRNDFLGLA